MTTGPFTLAFANLGRYLQYFPQLTKPLGSTNANVMLTYFRDWADFKGGSDGRFYRSSDDIEADTGLSYREQYSARQQLVKVGILTEHHARLEHRLYFSLNLGPLEEILRNAFSAIREMPSAQLGDNTFRSSIKKESTRESSFVENGEQAEGDLFVEPGANVDKDPTPQEAPRPPSRVDRWTAAFESGWHAFPTQRKGGRPGALRAWLAIPKRDHDIDPEVVVDAIKAYAKSDEVLRGFAKGMMAWLNDDRWTVDYGASKPPATTPTGRFAQEMMRHRPPAPSKKTAAEYMAELNADRTGE